MNDVQQGNMCSGPRRPEASHLLSARRFQAAPLKYLMLMNTLPALYRVGVPLALIDRLYGWVR